MSGTVGIKEKEFALARILELVALVLAGVPKTRAYRQVYPHAKCNPNSANRQANRMLAKYDELAGEEAGNLLEKYNLGVPRVIQELEKRLAAKAVFQGKETTAPDNSTRMRATELLARFHGLDKGYTGVAGDKTTNNNIVLVQAKLSEEEWETRYGGGVTQ